MPSDIREVYIARVTMSSPNAVASQKAIDDMTQEVTFEFEKKVREEIRTVRGKFRRQILRECLHFHGLQVISAETKETVANLVESANKGLRAISPDLHATLVPIPISVDARGKGVLFEAMTNAIHGQVYDNLLKRLEKLARKKDIPERSRKALVALCDRAVSWNVLGDPEVEKLIASYRKSFADGIVAPIAEEIEAAAKDLENAASFLEL